MSGGSFCRFVKTARLLEADGRKSPGLYTDGNTAVYPTNLRVRRIGVLRAYVRGQGNPYCLGIDAAKELKTA